MCGYHRASGTSISMLGPEEASSATGMVGSIGGGGKADGIGTGCNGGIIMLGKVAMGGGEGVTSAVWSPKFSFSLISCLAIAIYVRHKRRNERRMYDSRLVATLVLALPNIGV